MGMGRFKAERSGGDFGVSYLLMCDNKRYCFRGFPDFIIHKEDIGAGRILVCIYRRDPVDQQPCTPKLDIWNR